MDQLHHIISLHGVPILIALIVVALFVGRKAKANPDLLVEGGRYKPVAHDRTHQHRE